MKKEKKWTGNGEKAWWADVVKMQKILSRLRSMNNKKLKIPERKHREEHFTKCDKCRYLSECIEKGRVMDITGLEDMRMHFTAGRHCKGWREP